MVDVVGATVDLTRSTRWIEPDTRIECEYKEREQFLDGDEANIPAVLMRRANAWISVVPFFLFVITSAISVLLYILFRRWHQKLTSRRTPPAEAPLRRALPGGVPPGYSSQVTLPLYSPSPPYPDEAGTESETVPSIELSDWRQGHSLEQDVEGHQPSSPPRELAATIDSPEQGNNRHTKACT